MSSQIVGGGPVQLDTGIPVTLANAIAAAQTTAALPSGSIVGPSANPTFAVNPSGAAGSRNIALNARGAGAVPTTVSVSVYASSDGGTTWQLYQAAIPLVASTVATDAVLQNVVAGLLYCLLVTTLTLGSASSVSVDGSVS